MLWASFTAGHDPQAERPLFAVWEEDWTGYYLHVSVRTLPLFIQMIEATL